MGTNGTVFHFPLVLRWGTTFGVLNMTRSSRGEDTGMFWLKRWLSVDTVCLKEIEVTLGLSFGYRRW